MTKWKSFSVETRREAIDALTQFLVDCGSIGTAHDEQILSPEGDPADPVPPPPEVAKLTAYFPWDTDLSWGRNWLDSAGYFTDTLYVDNVLIASEIPIDAEILIDPARTGADPGGKVPCFALRHERRGMDGERSVRTGQESRFPGVLRQTDLAAGTNDIDIGDLRVCFEDAIQDGCVHEPVMSGRNGREGRPLPDRGLADGCIGVCRLLSDRSRYRGGRGGRLGFLFLRLQAGRLRLLCGLHPGRNVCLGGFLARRRDLPLVVHVQDLQLDAARELGILRQPLLLSGLAGLERPALNTVWKMSTRPSLSSSRASR